MANVRVSGANAIIADILLTVISKQLRKKTKPTAETTLDIG